MSGGFIFSEVLLLIKAMPVIRPVLLQRSLLGMMLFISFLYVKVIVRRLTSIEEQEK